jgi:hypothetical protein
MKINAPILGLAGATTICLFYTALAVVLKFWPVQTLNVIGTIHMMPKLQLIKSFIKVTPEAIATGIISHAVATFVILWLIASIYNLFSK